MFLNQNYDLNYLHTVEFRLDGTKINGENGQRHTVAWPAGSQGWCARGPGIETRGSHHIISHPISRQIGFSGSGVSVNTCFVFLGKCINFTHKIVTKKRDFANFTVVLYRS